LTWKGDNTNNLWDTGTNANWLNDGVADRFYFLDDVVFDSTGSTNPAVNLVGDLTPNSLTVDAAVNYTLGGNGKITGTTGLVKTNSGTLTITTTNDFTGPTIIGGGVLSVSRLANAGTASSIGAAALDSANLVFFGSTLRFTGGTTATDRGATLNDAGATFEVTNSSATLTWNGTNIGTGALIKSGAGTLTLTAENLFSGGTIVSNGMLALYGPAGGASITANDYALGSGGVTLYGGILKLFGGKAGDADAGYGTFSRPINIPAGATASLYAPTRYTMSSTLTGGGTLNFDVNYVRGTLSGNWSAFTGLINVTAYTSPAEFRVANTYGYSNATIYLNDNVIMDRSGSAATIEIGALGGSSGAVVGKGNSTSSGSSYRVGWNNADATFAGQLQADGVNTFTKVGIGRWILTGANSYTGGTVVDGGMLEVDNTSGSGTGTGAVTVNTGATLAGSGIISGAVTVNSGATVAPGSSGIGTLTVNNSVTLSGGSVCVVEINKTSLTKDQLYASGTLNYGGSLIVTNLSGTLMAGDSFKIFNGSSYAGSFTNITLPALSADVMWNTNSLTTSGTINVVSTNFTGPQSLVWIGDSVSNLWDTGASLNWQTTNGIARVFYNSDAVTFNDTGSASPAINLVTAVTPASVTVTGAQNYTFSGVGGLGGTMSLTKAGIGTLMLANTGGNSFTGGTTIQGGTVQVGDGTVNSSLTGTIANNGALVFNNPGALSPAVSITGSGKLTKRGAGTLTLSTQTYTNSTTIEAGTLTFSGTPPPGNVTNTGTLNLNITSPITYGAFISGTGNINIGSSYTNTFSGSCTYSGGTTNSSGTLVLANNTAAGSGPVTYLAGSVKVGSGVVIANTFVLPSSTTDFMMDTYGGGTCTWAGDIVPTGGSASFRPGGTDGRLVLTGTAAMGGRNFIVPKGSVDIAGSANFSATGTATAFGRNSTHNSAFVTIKNDATVALGKLSLGGGTATGGRVTVTIQDNASLSTGTEDFDLHNSTQTATWTMVSLNGGTLTVGGFVKSQSSSGRVTTNNFNGGLLRAGKSNAAFLPALSGLTVNVQTGGARVDDNGFAITIAAPLPHDPALGAILDGGFTKLGAGTLTLSSANTFTGPTLVNAGTLVLASSGSIAASANIGVAAGAVFDVSSVSGYSLNSGRTLWGNGTVNGNCSLGSGAILAPGSNAIGTLTFTSSLTLAAGSTNLFEISHSPLTNDQAAIAGALTCGGTLMVTTNGGAALMAGDSFKLFNAGSYNGGFTNVILPSLNSGLAWNTNNLTASGVISIVSTPPVIHSPTLSGTNFTFTITGGTAGATFYMLTSTNLARPLSLWERSATNNFDAGGNFSFTSAFNAQEPARFFLLQIPSVAPVFGSVNVQGASLVMSGSGGVANANYYVLTSTNLARPFSLWERTAMYRFDAGGNFSFTNAINAQPPAQFFLLQLP
jgi:autotransporter-associated beta strand protein